MPEEVNRNCALQRTRYYSTTFNPLHRHWTPQYTSSQTCWQTDRRTDRRQYRVNSR